jgi:O-antigen ligase/Flp pilus assembly protein TadD
MKNNRSSTCSKFVWYFLFSATPYLYLSWIYEGTLLPKLAAVQILLILLLILNVNTRELIWKPSPVLLPITCYLAISAISITQSVNRVESYLQLAQYTTLVSVAIITLFALAPSSYRRVFAVAAWSGLPLALLGIGQYFGWQPWHVPSNAQPSATFFHRNAAAEYLLCVIPFAWVEFRRARSRKACVASAALLSLFCIFLIFTRTRGAWVGLTAAVVLVTLISLIYRSRVRSPLSQFRARLMAAMALVVVLAATLPDNIQHPGSQHFDEKKSDAITAIRSITTEQGHRGRLNLWRHTLDMIVANPLLGVGLGNWQFLYPAFSRGDQVNVSASPSRPHNDLLWVASELGLLGLLAFLVILIVVGRMALALIRVRDDSTRTITLAMSVLVLAHLGDGLFNFPRERIVPAFSFWFGLGCIARLHFEDFENKERRISTEVSTVASTLLFAVLVVAFCITVLRLQYDAHHLRVHVAERMGNWNQVKAEAELADALGPLRFRTYTALGLARSRLGDLIGAESAYRTALLLHPNYPHTYNNLGIVLRRTGRPLEAVDTLEQALVLYPGFPEAHNNLGQAFRDLGRLDEAIAAYEKALPQKQNVPQVHFNLGEAYRMQGRLIRAQEYYIAALKQNPEYAPAILALERMGISYKGLRGKPVVEDTPDVP